MRLVNDFDGLDCPLEQILGELEPTSRIGDRWRRREPFTDPGLGLSVVDDAGVEGILRFPIKPPSPIHTARLLATIEQYAGIEHPHLERLLDWGLLDGHPWIVVAAEPLQSVIAERARGSQLRPEICATYVEALEKLEREGPRVACVVVTLENEWAADLYRAVGQRDPAIRRFALIV